MTKDQILLEITKSIKNQKTANKEAEKRYKELKKIKVVFSRQYIPIITEVSKFKSAMGEKIDFIEINVCGNVYDKLYLRAICKNWGNFSFNDQTRLAKTLYGKFGIKVNVNFTN